MVIKINIYTNTMRKTNMSKLKNRIIKRIKMTIDAFQCDCRFSIKLAFFRMADDLLTRANIKVIASFFHQKKDKLILNYLSNELKNVILEYRGKMYGGTYIENAPIWVCWWSGIEDAPELVKQCIKSIKKNSGGHRVYFISKDTYEQYITLPDYILERFNEGNMCAAHFSDYLRYSLLEKYGGLWLDATIFVSQTLPEEYFLSPFFTCKSMIRETRFISKYRWTTFCIGGWKESLLFSFLKNSLEEYWKHNDLAIDYLMTDYLIEIAYNDILSIREQIDKVPVNNPNRDDLQAAMNAAMKSDEINSVLKTKTVLYKLSWREKYSLVTESGEKSIYAGFLELQI